MLVALGLRPIKCLVLVFSVNRLRATPFFVSVSVVSASKPRGGWQIEKGKEVNRKLPGDFSNIRVYGSCASLPILKYNLSR